MAGGALIALSKLFQPSFEARTDPDTPRFPPAAPSHVVIPSLPAFILRRAAFAFLPPFSLRRAFCGAAILAASFFCLRRADDSSRVVSPPWRIAPAFIFRRAALGLQT